MIFTLFQCVLYGNITLFQYELDKNNAFSPPRSTNLEKWIGNNTSLKPRDTFFVGVPWLVDEIYGVRLVSARTISPGISVTARARRRR